MSGLKLIRFTLFLKFVLQYRRNIYFINNINRAFFTRNLRQSADYNSIYEFIAYFTGEFGDFQIFPNAPYKSVNVQRCALGIGYFFFQSGNLFFQRVLLVRILPYKIQTNIFGHFTLSLCPHRQTVIRRESSSKRRCLAFSSFLNNRKSSKIISYEKGDFGL